MISYNVHGLAARDSRLRLKRFLADLHPPCQVLCIQEHKLRSGSENLLRMQIWNSVYFFTAPARDGVHAQQNDAIPTGAGGAFIAVNPQLATHITQQGTILQSQGVWIHLDHLATGKMGIANIYALNSAAERITLWRHLFVTLDASIPWIFTYDWKMVEGFQYQRGGKNTLVAGREKRVWNHFKCRFNLVDNFAPKRGHLLYSWDNRKQFRHNPTAQSRDNIGDRILKRLDRCYHSAGLLCSSLEPSSTICPGFNLSDHAPLLINLQQCLHQHLARYKMNVSHLLDPELLARLEAMWAADELKATIIGTSTEDLFFKGLYKSKRITRTWGKHRWDHRRREEKELRLKFKGAQL